MRDWITEDMLDEMRDHDIRLGKLEKELAIKTGMPYGSVNLHGEDKSVRNDVSCGGGKMKRAFLESQDGEYYG
jgi:hypothetical protein